MSRIFKAHIFKVHIYIITSFWGGVVLQALVHNFILK